MEKRSIIWNNHKENIYHIMNSVEKIIHILNCLSASDRSLGITEISLKLSIPKSTVHRILSILLNYSLVSKESDTSRYRLGVQILKYSNSFYNSFDLRRYSKTVLKRTCLDTGLTTFLCIWQDGKGICIDSARSFQNPQMHHLFVDIGKIMPFHCAAAAKILLAYQSSEEIDRLIKNTSFQRYTSKTIVDPERLWEHLKEIKSKGFAICDEELEEGIRAISAPIRNFNGKTVASITVTGLVNRITSAVFDQLVKTVVNAANEISQMIGYNK